MGVGLGIVVTAAPGLEVINGPFDGRTGDLGVSCAHGQGALQLIFFVLQVAGHELVGLLCGFAYCT